MSDRSLSRREKMMRKGHRGIHTARAVINVLVRTDMNDCMQHGQASVLGLSGYTMQAPTS
jgi:hypothetical protein